MRGIYLSITHRFFRGWEMAVRFGCDRFFLMFFRLATRANTSVYSQSY